MLLTDINTALLERAISIYLEHAYPNEDSPLFARIQDLLDWKHQSNDNAIWEDPRFEVVENADLKHFFLRLGNEQYPHMKLGVMQCSGSSAEYVFVVDTHDQHFEIDPKTPDADEFRRLQKSNELLKSKIEEKWRKANIPTPGSMELNSVKNHKKQPLAKNGITVLAVDDTFETLQLESVILKRNGYNVIGCACGKEAINAIKSNQIDACILDIMMPEMDGYEVVKYLENNDLRSFPIILASAIPKRLINMENVDGYISKPFMSSELIAAVEICLKPTESLN